MSSKSSDSSGQRIAKWIAHAGICSRRDAEKLIEQGRVSVNGAIAESPAIKVTDPSTIKVDGEALASSEKTKLWMFYKPKGVITTHKDPQGRPTLFSLLPKKMPRVISIGRLDFNTEGLILLTNDGELSRHLELPATGWIRTYRVRVFGSAAPSKLAAIEKGVTIEGVRYAPATIRTESAKKSGGQNQWLTISVKEGKNREVRKLLDFAGLKVTRLIRISYGPFQLADLAEGELREVSNKAMREWLGNWKK